MHHSILGRAARVGLFLVAFAFSGSSLLAQVEGRAPREPVRAPAARSTAAPAVVERVKLGDLSGSAAIGPDEAPVTIVAFIDYECPYCARAHATIEEIRRAYPNAVRVVFKHSPLEFHPQADLAAEAALVAMVLGEFSLMHALMLENQKGLTRDGLPEIAEAAGMSRSAFEKALDTGDFAADVKVDKELARRIGVSSTPFFFVNGRPVRGARPFATFKAIIDAELASPKSPSRWVDRVPRPAPRDAQSAVGQARPRAPSAAADTELAGLVANTPNEALLVRHIARLTREVDSLHAEIAELRRALATVAALARKQSSSAASRSETRSDRIEKVGRVSLDDDPALGSKDAKVGIVAFADYGCPYSRKFTRYILPMLRERFIDTGKARFIYRDRPLDYRAESMRAAVAANCAGRQGDYWRMHAALYEVEGLLENQDLLALATQNGFDAKALGECLEDESARLEVEKDIREATSEALGLRVVPTLFVGRIDGNELVDAVRVSGVQSVRVLAKLIESFGR